MEEGSMPQYGGSGPFGLFFWTHHDFELIVSTLSRILDEQRRLQATVNQLVKRETTIMSALDDLAAQVKANTDVEQSAVTLIQGIAKQLQDAISAEDDAAIQLLSTQLQASATALSEAITANTPSTSTDPVVNPLGRR